MNTDLQITFGIYFIIGFGIVFTATVIIDIIKQYKELNELKKEVARYKKLIS